MIALAFTLAHAGFLCLCLAMSRHYREVFQKPLSERRAPLLRWSGWLLLIASLAIAMAHAGGAIGTVLWIGLLTAAAAPLVLLLTYAPRRLPLFAAGLLPLSLIIALSLF